MGKPITAVRRWRKLQARRRMIALLMRDISAKEELTLIERTKCGTAIRSLSEYIAELEKHCPLERYLPLERQNNEP